MKYYIVNKNNKILDKMHNREELLKTIREYHGLMYYCTNGAHNYSCRTLCEIFNEHEIDYSSNDDYLKIVYKP